MQVTVKSKIPIVSSSLDVPTTTVVTMSSSRPSTLCGRSYQWYVCLFVCLFFRHWMCPVHAGVHVLCINVYACLCVFSSSIIWCSLECWYYYFEVYPTHTHTHTHTQNLLHAQKLLFWPFLVTNISLTFLLRYLWPSPCSWLGTIWSGSPSFLPTYLLFLHPSFTLSCHQPGCHSTIPPVC